MDIPGEMSPKGLKHFSRILESVVRMGGGGITTGTLWGVVVHRSPHLILSVTP